MSLRRHLDTPTSPVRLLMDEALPHVTACRPQVRAVLAGATTVLPDRHGSPSPPWSLLGHAISARLLWELEPSTDGTVGGTSLGTAAFWLHGQPLWDDLLAAAASSPRDLPPADAAAVAWIAGLVDQAYRSGIEDDAAIAVLQAAGRLEDCLEPEWAADIHAVWRHAQPIVERHVTVGATVDPRLAGARAVSGADADYVTHNGLLVDIKAVIKPGFRSRDIRQIVAYALLDWDDDHQITAVGLLFARQGRLVTWPLDDLLRTLAGDDDIDLAALRLRLAEVLRH